MRVRTINLLAVVGLLCATTLAPARARAQGPLVYRWYLSSANYHFYTNNPSEQPPGWNAEGPAFRMLADGTPGTVTLYRLRRPDGGHFYTVAGPELDRVKGWGWVLEGPLGAMGTSQLPGTVPLHRHLKPNGRHFFSLAKEEGDRVGFKYEGVVGYVLPAPAPAPVVATRDRAHGWNEKANQWESCFGAVGDRCFGINIFGMGAPVVRNADGSYTAYVSVGSILHDNCCYANGPSARWCQPNEAADLALATADQFSPAGQAKPCHAEWDKAVYNLKDGRQWQVRFGPYGAEGGDDLSPAPARPAQLVVNGKWVPWGGQESVMTRRLAAPSGTALDVSDEAFCASGKFRRPLPFAPPGIGQWGVCQ